jgi:uncharacterized membrane protein YczE
MRCYTELAYVFGILALAFGTALMVKADFGVSMVVAPAYLVFLKLSQILPFVTFGMAEYLFQAILLIAMIMVLKRFKIWYMFSFITAVFYGICLDLFIRLVSPMTMVTFPSRLFFYVIGGGFCAMGIAFIFRTYIAPEVYELFVKEISSRYKIDIHRFKMIYDMMSCVVSIALSFVFFGWLQFEGVKWGTAILAVVNGKAIGLFNHLFDRMFYYEDGLPFRRFFTGGAEESMPERQIVS